MYSRSVFGTAYRSIQDPSTDARDDKDGFCFQRSFDSRGLCPREAKDDRREGVFGRDDRENLF